MRRFLRWMDGRKTYLLSGALVLGVVALVFLGQISPAEAVSWTIAAAFAFTFRSALQKNHAQVLRLLEDVGLAGVAWRKHDKRALAAVAVDAVKDGEVLAAEIQQEEKTS